MQDSFLIAMAVTNLFICIFILNKMKVPTVTPKLPKSPLLESSFLKPYGKQSSKKKPVVNDDVKAFEKEHQ
jgi:hypothetical protein